MLLEIAVLISGVGNGISMIAIPWLVLERTGQAMSAGLVGTATALPLLASALFSGSIVDTFGRRRVSMVSDVCSAVSAAAIPLVDRWLGLDMALILGLVVLGSIFDPAGSTAREAMIPELGEKAGWALPRTNSVHEAVWGIAYLIGPALGGVLIASIGPSSTLWVTAAAFVVAALCVAAVKAPGIGTPHPEDRPKSLLGGSVEGLRLVWRDPLLRSTTVLTMFVLAVYMPVEGVILPYVFERQGRSAALGSVLTAMAAGSILGALLFAAIGHRFRRRRVFAVATVVASASILMMSLAPNLTTLLIAALFAGFFWGPVDPLINTALQTRTEPARRGRVLGVLMATYYAAGPLGYLAAGAGVERFGANATFVSLAAALLAITATAAFLPSFRHFDSTADAP